MPIVVGPTGDNTTTIIDGHHRFTLMEKTLHSFKPARLHTYSIFKARTSRAYVSNSSS
ncbi:hypothetical protein JCM19239_2669 [Vibrio variabilis]|uniref:ParB/Sulfiredoxin domain-containing protein n=1 Tax=Vibrio variabilis TaxID=990271 RepID=A0ABQ0JNJ6_9VIBR|nr:hypothetical protein JCM19239_2669 [Vibrio variabilis]